MDKLLSKYHFIAILLIIGEILYFSSPFPYNHDCVSKSIELCIKNSQIYNNFASPIFTLLAFLAAACSVYFLKKQIDDTTRSAAKQSFENTFFQLMNLIHQQRTNCMISSYEHIQHSNEVFQTAFDAVCKEETLPNLEILMGYIYNALLLVDNLSDNEHKYAKMLFNCLSNKEMVAILIYGTYEKRGKPLKEYLIKFQAIKHLYLDEVPFDKQVIIKKHYL